MLNTTNAATFGVQPLLARVCAKYHPLRKRPVPQPGFGQDHVYSKATIGVPKATTLKC